MIKTIWRFVNSPIIVALMCVVPLVVAVRSCSKSMDPFRTDQSHRWRVEALPRLQVLTFAEARVPTNAPQKFVGVLRNNSRFIVSDIQGAVCFFDANQELVDVITAPLEGAASVAPGATNIFTIERPTGREYAYPTYRPTATTTDFRFMSVTATEAK